MSVSGRDIVVHVHVIVMRVCELTVPVTCFYGHELICTRERINVVCGHQYHTQDHHDKHASKDVVASRHPRQKTLAAYDSTAAHVVRVQSTQQSPTKTGK